MHRFDPSHPPRPALPPAHAALAGRLEALDIDTWCQGEGLLADLFPERIGAAPTAPHPTRVLLCRAAPERVLSALPRAVVTADRGRRISLGTTAGPVDLLPIGERPVAETLPRFGLGPLCIAWRPATGDWCDPLRLREELADGWLALSGPGTRLDPALETNVFWRAPRRYWIAARLLSEFELEPTPALIDAARDALASTRDRLPTGAPARREIQRVLLARRPSAGLRFLFDSGVCEAFFPGIVRDGARVLESLAADPSLRWAALLSGTSARAACRRLRIPHALARSIERLVQYHPIEARADALGEAGVRRIHQRLTAPEIEALIAWRSSELDCSPADPGAEAARRALEAVSTRLEEISKRQAASGRVRELALRGQDVMDILECRPGAHVGRALSHLAAFIEAHPESNEHTLLAQELRAWADRNPGQWA